MDSKILEEDENSRLNALTSDPDDEATVQLSEIEEDDKEKD